MLKHWYTFGTIFVLAMMCCVGLCPEASAQSDPGIPDTIWVAPLTVTYGEASQVDLFLANDQALTAVEITVTTGDSLIATDSVSFTGGRVSYVFSKGWSVDDSSGAITVYCYPFDEPLVQPGSGKVATLYLRHPNLPEVPYEAIIDSISIEVGLIFHTTSLRDSLGTVFSPQFRSGVLRVAALACCPGTTGNINGDSGNTVDLSDLIFLVNYLFQGGAAPACGTAANVNGDDQCAVDLSDLIYLVNYLFSGGATPAPCLSACQ